MLQSPLFKSVLGRWFKSTIRLFLVVMETRVGGNRAREITKRLPFDGAIHSDAIGFTGGIWVLWNSNRVDVAHLANTEQEIHFTVKV